MLKKALATGIALALGSMAFNSMAASIELVSASGTTRTGDVPGGGSARGPVYELGCGVKYDFAVKVSDRYSGAKSVTILHNTGYSDSQAWNSTALTLQKSLADGSQLWALKSDFEYNCPFYDSGNHDIYKEFKQFKIVYDRDGQTYLDDNIGENYSLQAPGLANYTGPGGGGQNAAKILYINGDEYSTTDSTGIANIESCGIDALYSRNYGYWRNAAYAMDCVNGKWYGDAAQKMSFYIPGPNPWPTSEGETSAGWIAIGDDNEDGLAQAGETDLIWPDMVDPYTPHTAVYNFLTKDYEVKEGDIDLQRTVVYIYGQTSNGQDMFLRGGLDHAYANSNGRNCSTTNFECALPIEFLNFKNGTTAPWKAGDTHLDWYGSEATQSNESEGSPMDWTTNEWPSDWGATPYYDVVGYGQDAENSFGMHFWKLDVMMDCSKTANGWFELKSYISNGPGWEGAIDQGTSHGEPYPSGNHFAQCGKKNVFFRDWVEVSGKGWKGPNDVIFEAL